MYVDQNSSTSENVHFTMHGAYLCWRGGQPLIELAASVSTICCNVRLGGLVAVQVRSAHRLSEHGLTQQLPISGITMQTDSSGDVFVITSGRDGIQQLIPTPFAQQAQALADLQQFPEALTLASLMPDNQVSTLDS